MSDANEPRELVYSSASDLRLDLYRSNDPADPVVIYLHGGGFARGSKGDDAGRLESLRRCGLTVASIDYGLAPSARFPRPVLDVGEAVAFLRRRGDDLGIDTHRIGLIGASAGGLLAAMAAIRGTDDERTAVQAVSVWFASSDLVESTRRSDLERRLLPVTYEANLLGDDYDDALLEQASPARSDLRAAPPFLIVHGDSDKVVPPRQSELLHEALSRAGRDSTLVRLANLGHEATQFDAGPLPALIGAWMRAHLTQA